MIRRVAALVLLVCVSSTTLAAEPTPGKQVEQSLKVGDDASIDYLLYLPEDYDDGEKEWPLVLFLHGRGESYGPLSLVAKWGPPRFAQRGDKLNYILVSPQCPKSDFWSRDSQQKLLAALLDHVTEKFSVDQKRVSLTGLSMGGYGSWTLAAAHPERFSAVIPICGGGDPGDAEKLASLPIWVFHGDKDRAVNFQKSVDMVEAIRKAGGKKVTFTTLENFGHNSWSAAYGSPEVMQWLVRQKRSD